MFHIVLFEPEIPPNTGNIIRLAANTGATLHLIHPLGFDLSDRQLKRAGMDYAELCRVYQYQSYEEFLHGHTAGTIYAASTKGATQYTDVNYFPGDTIIFGPETRGLPETFLQDVGGNNVIKIPMQNNSRSLNLSNTVAIILYEALRQNGFQTLD
ncbi:MAG: tRNA (cytidine(34)-2'-O)-methyltransferase [Gammaproteobacteria bacterium]|nr:tRNA (cytidine(34)-2'-O)-methyltransferase [Gammaproteobacteria bacterium]